MSSADLVSEFNRLQTALDDTAFINLYNSLTPEQINGIGSDDWWMINTELGDRQMHQLACEASPGECSPPCPEQNYDRCAAERGAFGFAVYFLAPMALGMGAGALLERAAATDAFASLAARTTTEPVVDSAARRVYLRNATRAAIQANAKRTPSGDFIDPNTFEVIPKEGPFDYGHKTGFEWWRTQKIAREQGWTRQEVIEYENDPSHYQIENPSSNRSHAYEQK